MRGGRGGAASTAADARVRSELLIEKTRSPNRRAAKIAYSVSASSVAVTWLSRLRRSWRPATSDTPIIASSKSAKRAVGALGMIARVHEGRTRSRHRVRRLTQRLRAGDARARRTT
jgi:hypothetical protein